MIVNLVDVDRIDAFETKCHSPITGYPNGKIALALAFQGMQSEAR